MSPLPRKGDKIQFRGGELWAFHTNCVENAKKLTPGEFYTVETVEMASSWTKVTVKELPTQGVYGDDWLALHFFQWPRCQVIKGADGEGRKSQCTNPAEYLYMAAKEGEISEFCSDCLFELSNGQPCSCEVNFIPGIDIQTDLETGENFDTGGFPPENVINLENIRWKWLDKGRSWYYIDGKGRPFPCCDYHPTDYLEAKGWEFLDSILK